MLPREKLRSQLRTEAGRLEMKRGTEPAFPQVLYSGRKRLTADRQYTPQADVASVEVVLLHAYAMR